MFKYFNTIENSVTGKPVGGAEIRLRDASGTTFVVYADALGTLPITQPILTDATGYFEFYAEEGATATLEVSYGGVVQRSIADVSFGENAGDVLGVSLPASNLGTFTTPLITNDSTVKSALEQLGAASEVRPTLTDMASTADDKGAALVGFKQDGADAANRTALAKLRELALSPEDFRTSPLLESDALALTRAVIAADLLGADLRILKQYTITGTWAPLEVTNLSISGYNHDKCGITGNDLSKSFVLLKVGGSIRLEKVAFDTWEGACKLKDNTDLAAFELLEAVRCKFNNIAFAPITDWDTWSSNGGVKLAVFERNIVTNAATTTIATANHGRGGIRLESAYLGTVICTFNKVLGVGSSTVDKQRAGIHFGGASRQQGTCYLVAFNVVDDVRNNAESPGGGTGQISGIAVLGPYATVIENKISNVFAHHANNTDNYGIYLKSSMSCCRGNKLTNAGGTQAMIMCKGMPNVPPGEEDFNSDDFDKVIADNFLYRTIAFPQDKQCVGITCYNPGHVIKDNFISGGHTGIIVIQPIYTSVEQVAVTGNRIYNLSGTAGYTNVAGIIANCPHKTRISGNTLDDIGTGVEATAYGISLLFNAVAGNYRDIAVNDNIIGTVSASTTNQARSINVVCDGTASTSIKNLVISRNIISFTGRGINIATSATTVINGMHINDNHVSDASVAAYSNTGVAATVWKGTAKGNTIDGVPWIISTNASDASVTIAIFGMNRVRTNNSAPTRITNLTGGIDGQRVSIQLGANDTVKNNTTIKLNGAADFVPGADGGSITLENVGGVWSEIARAKYAA